MDFVIYDASTGDIKQIGQCPDKDIDLQAPTDTSLALLKGVTANPATQMVDTSTGGLVARPAPAPTTRDVNAERDRRLRAGVAVTVSGVTIPVQADTDSMVLVSGLGSGATAQIAAGNGAVQMPTPFRDAQNVDHALTWAEMQALGLGTLAAASTLYAKSWALKALRPIPADYTADSYWM